MAAMKRQHGLENVHPQVVKGEREGIDLNEL